MKRSPSRSVSGAAGCSATAPAAAKQASRRRHGRGQRHVPARGQSGEPYAKAALRRLYIALWRGNIADWSLERFETATGLSLTYDGGLKEDLPPMPKFLNRLLALPIAEQNALFGALEERIAALVAEAMESGSYDRGVEAVHADSLVLASRGRCSRMRPPAPSPSFARSSAATSWSR